MAKRTPVMALAAKAKRKTSIHLSPWLIQRLDLWAEALGVPRSVLLHMGGVWFLTAMARLDPGRHRRSDLVMELRAEFDTLLKTLEEKI